MIFKYISHPVLTLSLLFFCLISQGIATTIPEHILQKVLNVPEDSLQNRQYIEVYKKDGSTLNGLGSITVNTSSKVRSKAVGMSNLKVIPDKRTHHSAITLQGEYIKPEETDSVAVYGVVGLPQETYWRFPLFSGRIEVTSILPFVAVEPQIVSQLNSTVDTIPIHEEELDSLLIRMPRAYYERVYNRLDACRIFAFAADEELLPKSTATKLSKATVTAAKEHTSPYVDRILKYHKSNVISLCQKSKQHSQRKEFDLARKYLEQARTIAPDSYWIIEAEKVLADRKRNRETEDSLQNELYTSITCHPYPEVRFLVATTKQSIGMGGSAGVLAQGALTITTPLESQTSFSATVPNGGKMYSGISRYYTYLTLSPVTLYTQDTVIQSLGGVLNDFNRRKLAKVGDELTRYVKTNKRNFGAVRTVTGLYPVAAIDSVRCIDKTGYPHNENVVFTIESGGIPLVSLSPDAKELYWFNEKDSLVVLDSTTFDIQRLASVPRAYAEYSVDLHKAISLFNSADSVEKIATTYNHKISAATTRILQEPKNKKLIETVLKHHPDNAPALILKAYNYLLDKDTDEALPYLEHAHRIRPDDYMLEYVLGLYYSQLDHYEESQKHYKAARKTVPDYPLFPTYKMMY